ncbi:MAG: MerR family DNA-binding transcriptional regulator [Devosiaceae bacterium]|nr:MerR family DNA-binding transcriptional regulator [Devosiaceae bacterium MH13]
MKPLDPMPPAETGTIETEYAIGELASEFDLTLRTLRFYEDKGLLRPRRVGLQRIYSRRDRARLKLIVMGKKVGFSLQEIGEMLDLYDLKDGQANQLQVARDRFLEQIELLETQKQDIEQAIAELERTVEVVTGMLKAKQDKKDQQGEPAIAG